MTQIQRRITAKERETVHAGLAQVKSGAQLAYELGRDPSVVNRKINRNGRRKGRRIGDFVALGALGSTASARLRIPPL